MLKIDSLSNEKIKLCAKIIESAKHRKQSGLFFLEGLRLCRDAVLSGCIIEFAFFTRKAIDSHSEDVDLICDAAKHYFEISDQIASKLSQTESSQGFYCICKIPECSYSVIDGGKYIALENIQDPSNLGAICRTAEALGIDGAIISGCCDRFSPKAQRAAMGSLLRINITECANLADYLGELKEKGFTVYATTPDTDSVVITRADMCGGVVAVIGNEGNGVSDEVFSVCDKLTIPMLGKAESLNASMAAAITMWEMMRCADER